MKIHDIDTFVNVVRERWHELNEINPEYLSDAGKAAKLAYREVYWLCSFHENLESLRDSEEFQRLVSIPDNHPEYYRVLRKVNRAVERICSDKEKEVL